VVGSLFLCHTPNQKTTHTTTKKAFSDPASVLRRAAAEGYRAADFIAAPLPFGQYSSQREVRVALKALRAEGRAFFGARKYMVAGALFVQRKREGGKEEEDEDLSAALLCALSALR
jgi:hypothetical protein